MPSRLCVSFLHCGRHLFGILQSPPTGLFFLGRQRRHRSHGSEREWSLRCNFTAPAQRDGEAERTRAARGQGQLFCFSDRQTSRRLEKIVEVDSVTFRTLGKSSQIRLRLGRTYFATGTSPTAHMLAHFRLYAHARVRRAGIR